MGGNNNSAGKRQLPKQKISFVLRDPKEVPHRKGINSLAMVNDHSRHEKGGVNFFSASRDRLIKLWQINYGINSPVSLLANLDGHTDWVNQIQWIPSSRTLVSCSNDTTIKIWKLYPFHETLEVGKSGPKTIISYSTLNDHTDYVRSLVYAGESYRLFSASDDGKICEWDLNNTKILTTYENELSSENKNPMLWVKNRFEKNYDN